MHDTPWWAWTGFLAFIAFLLALDLGVFHRESRAVPMKEALGWCVAWVSLALGFNVLVWLWRGPQAGQEFLAGYLVELSLSVDNVFVFILLFSFFGVAKELHHRVLFWGILGAVAMRAAFIFAGLELLEAFHWAIYVLGAFLVYTAAKMAFAKPAEDLDPSRNVVVRLARRVLPVTEHYHGERFFVRKDGLLHATPLFIVLIAVETTDLVFAVDSIPAILAITRDEFVVFTSNIFAILGLRSFYFALSGVMAQLRFLSVGLAVVLGFIGVKMLVSGFFHVPIQVSLGIIAVTLGGAVAASLAFPEKTAAAQGE